jgi:hypothetical protein
MADNSARTPGFGEEIRTVEKSSAKTGVTIIDRGGSGAESLVSATSGLYVAPEAVAAVATSISLASGTSSVQVLASNTSRRGVMLNNTDEYDCYVKYGTAATSVSFAVKIPAGSYWEMPAPIYTGVIEAVWAGDGSGRLVGVEL